MQGYPQTLNNFRVYNQSQAQLGVVDAELPSIEFLTETVSGAGIAGEVECPVPGHAKSLTLKLKWLMATEASSAMARSEVQEIELRGSAQALDPAKGRLDYPIKVALRVLPKKNNPGKFEVGKKMEGETEHEALYMKLVVDGKDAIEIDKFNFVYKVGGVDQFAGIRSHLGM